MSDLGEFNLILSDYFWFKQILTFTKEKHNTKCKTVQRAIEIHLDARMKCCFVGCSHNHTTTTTTKKGNFLSISHSIFILSFIRTYAKFYYRLCISINFGPKRCVSANYCLIIYLLTIPMNHFIDSN